ncbi:MAG: lipid-A-disaccharide synthase [Paracoccaceae bacterium]
MSAAPLIYLIAGEASGDRLGAALMDGLVQLDPDTRFAGVGGPLMAARGLASLFPIDELSIMGLVEVLPRLRSLFARRDEVAADIIARQPAALITIDSPGFTLRVALAARKGCAAPFIHYVAPSVWAWKPGRAAKMARSIDHVLALLPFEPPYMQAAGMSCDFVGHPIAAEPKATPEAVAGLRKQLGIAAGTRILTLLPGSRAGEVARLAPIFAETARLLVEKHPNLVPLVPAARPNLVAPLRAAFAGTNAIILPPLADYDAYEAQKRTVFAASSAALAASGTVSLELAAAAVPMVIGYQMNAVTGWLMRQMALVDTVTLVNLLSDSRAVPEFLFSACKPENLMPALDLLLENPAAAAAQRAASAVAMREVGTGDEAPGLRAARAVMAQIRL